MYIQNIGSLEMLQCGRVQQMKPRTRRVMNRLPVFLWLLLGGVHWQHPRPAAALFVFRLLNPCRSTNRLIRCGLFNLSVLMHRGDANTDQCVETCVAFPNRYSDLNCGSCTIIENNDTPQPGFSVYLDLVNIKGIGNGTFFEQARNRWEKVVTGSLGDIITSSLDFRLSSKNCTPPDIIDDLYICALYTKIDGPGTILGSAGPIEVRMDNSLPIIGEMKFDFTDVYKLQKSGDFANVIVHEMGHILGIGSLWTVTSVTGPRSQNCPYKGPMATSEFRKVSNCSLAKVPTETDFDRAGGTFCSHWDELCLGSELMTGFLEKNNQSSHPLSRITIAGLEDLGYTVDYSTADEFTADDLDDKCQCTTKASTRQRREALQPANRKRLRTIEKMDSGVHQFGLVEESASSLLSGRKSPRRQRRRISDKAYDVAMSYGLNLLSQRRTEYQIRNKIASAVSNDDAISSNSAETAKTRYIGDQVVSVLVEDGGEIYGVMVINDEAIR